MKSKPFPLSTEFWHSLEVQALTGDQLRWFISACLRQWDTGGFRDLDDLSTQCPGAALVMPIGTLFDLFPKGDDDLLGNPYVARMRSEELRRSQLRGEAAREAQFRRWAKREQKAPQIEMELPQPEPVEAKQLNPVEGVDYYVVGGIKYDVTTAGLFRVKAWRERQK